MTKKNFLLHRIRFLPPLHLLLLRLCYHHQTQHTPMSSFKKCSKSFQTSSRNGLQWRLPNTSLQGIPTGLQRSLLIVR
ncbi:TRIAD3 protein [Cryptococcus neoformans Tu401-1]|nr:TRIAD3 protein [Cryptococcus neoformans var. grubii Tu401-1]OXM75378.1 TRIAD3 protein [Cryptococcus neoformans var. grubii Bt63]